MVQSIIDLQRQMSKVQSFIPGLPALVVSPAKAVVSVAEIAYGIALFVIFGAVSSLFTCDSLHEKVVEGLAHAGFGFASLIYSAGNFFTLGLLGYALEDRMIEIIIHGRVQALGKQVLLTS